MSKEAIMAWKGWGKQQRSLSWQQHFWLSFKEITFQKQMNTAGAADILLGQSDEEKISALAFWTYPQLLYHTLIVN
jgi:hypothetical protein